MKLTRSLKWVKWPNPVVALEGERGWDGGGGPERLNCGCEGGRRIGYGLKANGLAKLLSDFVAYCDVSPAEDPEAKRCQGAKIALL